jgi:hypothetical protein
MVRRAINWLSNVTLWVLICCAVVLTIAASPQRRRTAIASEPRIDYSRFSHLTDQHRAVCSSCHAFPSKNWKAVRKSDDAFPDVTEYPEHQACLSCHRQQFFARERPVPRICSNCHVRATPIETSRYPFPSLGEVFLSTVKARDFISDFHVQFPHEKHADADCADCHQMHQPQGKSDDEFVTKPPKNIGDAFWLKKGTFKTRPLTHAGCFACHNQESELAPLPPNCGACHKPPAAEKRAVDFDAKLANTIGVQDWWSLTAWRHRVSAGAFRHEVHSDLKCAQCHQSAAMRAVPVKSCGGAEGCHITATSDEGGILNYEIDQRNKASGFVCTKCHLVFGSNAVPASHINAIPKPAK